MTRTNGTMAPQSERWRGWLKSAVDLIIIFIMVMVAKTVIAEPYYVPSASMEPTLLIGDELLAMKWAYGYGTSSLPVSIVLPMTHHIFGGLPQRGDVVVFRWPGDESQIWVKRVIGLPGDHVQMREGRVWLNGKPVGLQADGTGEAEADNGVKVPAARFIETLPGGRKHLIFKLHDNMLDNTPDVLVPPGHVFVMGDNRDNSADSRVPLAMGGVGLLPVDNLVGRVQVLIGSWDLGMKSQPIWTWPSGFRWSRFFTAVH